MTVPGKRGQAVKVTCKCGYVGRSNYPATYLCSVCYYAHWAATELERAASLEARALKFRQSAAEHQAASEAAQQRRLQRRGATSKGS